MILFRIPRSSILPVIRDNPFEELRVAIRC